MTSIYGLGGLGAPRALSRRLVLTIGHVAGNVDRTSTLLVIELSLYFSHLLLGLLVLVEHFELSIRRLEHQISQLDLLELGVAARLLIVTATTA